jgi:hypothetical protein
LFKHQNELINLKFTSYLKGTDFDRVTQIILVILNNSLRLNMFEMESSYFHYKNKIEGASFNAQNLYFSLGTALATIFINTIFFDKINEKNSPRSSGETFLDNLSETNKELILLFKIRDKPTNQTAEEHNQVLLKKHKFVEDIVSGEETPPYP